MCSCKLFKEQCNIYLITNCSPIKVLLADFKLIGSNIYTTTDEQSPVNCQLNPESGQSPPCDSPCHSSSPWLCEILCLISCKSQWHFLIAPEPQCATDKCCFLFGTPSTYSTLCFWPHEPSTILSNSFSSLPHSYSVHGCFLHPYSS